MFVVTAVAFIIYNDSRVINDTNCGLLYSYTKFKNTENIHSMQKYI